MAVTALISSCSVDSPENHYLFAEKFWNQGKYLAAVREFEMAFHKDPKGKVGLEALFRAASTESLFLSNYNEAIKKFELFIQTSHDQALLWEAKKQLGEILFSKISNHTKAIHHYETLLRQYPQAQEVSEFLWRIAKSYFYLFKFDRAVATYQQIIKNHSQTSFAEKAAYEIGVSYFTQGGKKSYEAAISAFKEFIKSYPKSSRIVEAHFGIGACYEELDRLDEATREYQGISASHPSSQIVKIKLQRLHERQLHRNH